MSRTYKDRPYKFSVEQQERDARWYYVPVEVAGFCTNGEPYTWVRNISMYRPGVIRKKKRHEVVEKHWMHNPGWFNKMFMNRPDRRKMRAWEHKVLLEVDIEDTDPPPMYMNEEWYW